MTRRNRFTPSLFLVAALLIAISLFTPRQAEAFTPALTDSTTAYTAFGGASDGVVIRATDRTIFCGFVSQVTQRVTMTTVTFTVTTVCPIRLMLVINREVSPSPFGDGQTIEQTATNQHTLTLENLSPGTGYRYRLLIVPDGGGTATEYDTGRFDTDQQGPLRDPNRAPHTANTPPAQLTRLTVTEAGFSEFGPLTRFDVQTSQAADTKIVLWAYGVQTRRINVPNAAQGASVTVQSQEDCRTYAYQITINDQVAKQGTFQTNRPNYGCHDAIPFPSADPTP